MSKFVRSAIVVVGAIALSLVLVSAARPSAVLADDQPDGSIIDPDQDVHGTWGPGTITATADVTNVNDDPDAGPLPSPPTTYVFLPAVMSVQAPATDPDPYPDLVVGSITVTSDSVRVIIRNQGGAPVLPEDTFWVDLYVDPNPVPTAVNQTWNDRCRYGLVWAVTPPLLPINPGDTILLTLGDVYYREEFSNFPESLDAGTLIYVQVDSANAETDYGGVLESHEAAGEPYNNIGEPVLSVPGFVYDGAVSPADIDERVPASYHLPHRP